MSTGVFCYIGLGSNLNQPVDQLRRAVSALEQLPQSQLINVSSFYRSSPVGPQDQPDFINAVACLHTQLPAAALLEQLQTIEKAHHRERLVHWGPRTLDLDLLLYGESTINSERLTVPHPHMKERAFVLVPLADIAPGLRLPDGESVTLLAAQCDRQGLAVTERDG
ncbi:2-amino-4-hydroxy-6-hydroxymethyldihydropteridine diphosphokinase [Gilvimarinus algae]|uniref:2-amino-4-hydroxy-6-hydroxymethyldihydropteridine pyrophosphokinase n=1 Tax=Gilvimarinus algae TaxID=3058037 RepID=A0ABT8TFS5_9GAMM|nr:2-amino-4-hydroxy-6-hydroxymethyldihydropteridine diphosphokinase [Gilvimarinus sp. SDUM040014]MDO3381958.1 2-amino-4-hydroxy-6-hydroxymethyldihydropteridine diphosphokinase [Gilvimarinus sp. SDUM040014]